ncbi:MAG: amidohydrolase family protein [Bilophila sp.]
MIRREFLKTSAIAAAILSVPELAQLAQAASETVVYTGGPVFTINAKNDIVEAVAVKDGVILAVGGKKEVLAAAGKDANIVDLKGKALLPGFIDGHSHFPNGAFRALNWINLNVPPLGSVTSIADLQECLRARIEKTKPGEWLIGYNYNDLAIKEQRHPTRADLDKVSTDRPIFVRHVSGHLGVANSLGLKLAGITESSTEPQGGKFRRGPDGKLDGVLEGPSAMLPVSNLFPPITDEQNMTAIAHDSMTYAMSGVTTAQNGGSPTLDDFFLKASDDGTLKIRLVIWPAGRNEKLIKSYGNKRSGAVLDKKGHVILGAAKLFADGSPQGYTAWLSKPYFKQLPGKPADFRGFPVFKNRDELFALVKKLHDDNWQIATHTNGDQAIQDVLDAYIAAVKANPRKDHRHVLNHCQFCRPDQVPLIAEYGIVPSYFVTHTWFWGDIHRTMVAGPERAAHISPLKAALDKGIPFALHNDTPVTPISPIMDVFSAVNRLTMSGYVLGPDQRISVMEALRGVTINGARMHFMEDKVGSLEPGKLADFVILDKDPTKIPAVKLKDLVVKETIVGGATVYKA